MVVSQRRNSLIRRIRKISGNPDFRTSFPGRRSGFRRPRSTSGPPSCADSEAVLALKATLGFSRMHSSTKRRLMLGMTGGLMMTGLGMAGAHADTTAAGETSLSHGVASGNLIQIPINAPVNVCGNQAGLVSAGDGDQGSTCATGGGSTSATGGSSGSSGSSGTASGDVIQIPVNIPVNVCGNQVTALDLLDSVTGSSCANGGPVDTATALPSPNPT
ncbi:chaplin, partial [Actinocrinis puniceicyclus]